MSYAENEHFTCPWPWCQCTHMGCVAGWIECVRDDGTEYADPCPTCRPEVARHLTVAENAQPRRRRELPNLPRPSRHRRSVDGAA